MTQPEAIYAAKRAVGSYRGQLPRKLGGLPTQISDETRYRLAADGRGHVNYNEVDEETRVHLLSRFWVVHHDYYEGTESIS